MTFALISLLSLLAVDSIPRPAVVPERASTAQGATVVVHRQPSIPLVSIRLSLIADDPPGFAGAGHLVQHLHQASMQDGVDQVGGEVQMVRTSDAVVYTVIGPASELDHLARTLRSALLLPRVSEEAVRIASRELAEERLAEWETAGNHVRATLRGRLFPEDISAAGTDRSAARLSTRTLPAAWAAMYRPDRVVVVAVGDVELQEVEAAFAELPPAGPTPPLPISRDTVLLEQLAPAEATRGWIGNGYLATGEDPTALSVAARLLRDDLRRRLPEGQVEVEHWWTHFGQALVVVAAVPGPTLAASQRTVGTALSSLEASVTAVAVRSAAQAIGRDMLFYSRTPDRMAEVLGTFIDRQGEPDAPQRFYAGLERVGVDQVRAVLDELLERSPVRVEIPPQRLQPPRRR